MKVILAGLNAKYIHSNLAVYDLEAYAKREGVENRISALAVREFTINHNLDFILQELYREKAQVYAFSCYIWNIYEVLTIARELKKVLPNCRIWVGGPEVSYDGENYLNHHSWIEGVIVGEGEVTFSHLMEVWEKTGDGDCRDEYKKVPGIMYRDREQKVCRTAPRPLMEMDDLPFVYHDLSAFKNKILYYETSRGCPYSCSYCLSSIDRKVRFRSFHLVKNELDFFLANRVPQVKFVDRTFNCDRSHALAIWRYLAEHDNGVTNFHFEIAADRIGEEEIEVFRTMRPGLIQLEIGLQSTNPDTIREIRRVMDVDKVKKVLLQIRELGNIHQHLDLIAGLPYEDLKSFKQSFNDAYSMRPNQLQLGFLKVLKGSYMGDQIDNYDLHYRDVQPYEVLSTKWISYDEILVLKRVEEMVEEYYNSDQFENVLPYAISFFDSPYSFFEALGSDYEKKELFGIGMRRESRYMALRDFCLQSLSGQPSFSMATFDSLLTFDYYLREKAKTRPQWSKEEPIDKKRYHGSKVAARKMHLEPLEKEAFLRLAKDRFQGEVEDVGYCLFDYDNRNPLSKDAAVTFLTGI